MPARGRGKRWCEHAGRPVNPLPDGVDLDQKILRALCAAGGSLIRSQRQYTIGRRIRAEPFGASTARLVARDAITIKDTIKDAAPDYTPRQISTTYALTERRKRRT